MKPQNLHAHEDRLLDFAYGELPAQEARAVETHLQGCTRCTELLEGIRGVRSTMAQLTLEPAPDAGLESLMAYAQQAARNAAAGPPLKPTWWRRWLIPAMGVTAVSVFGIISLQVSKSVDLAPELTATAQRESKAEAASVAATPPAPAPAVLAEPPAPPAEAAMAGMTPPPPEPAAKFDDKVFEKAKAAPRKKAVAMKPSPYDGNSDWSNAGVGASRALERDAAEDTLQEQNKDHVYDRRDAMTQGGSFPKSRSSLAVTGKGAPATPAPAPAPAQAAPPPPMTAQPSAPADEAMNEQAGMDDAYAASEAEVQQQGPSRNGLRLSETKRGSNAPAADKDAEAAEVASLDVARTAPTTREQRTRAPQATSAAPAAPSGGGSTGRAERQAASPAELTKLADAARRQNNRVLEAQYLRLAVDAAAGKDRLDLLNRLCDAEFSIGRPQAANDACSQVIDEAPSSNAAQMARRRLSKEFGDAKPGSRLSAPKSSSPLKADDMESVPAQAQ
jgi:hypothetical protein